MATGNPLSRSLIGLRGAGRIESMLSSTSVALLLYIVALIVAEFTQPWHPRPADVFPIPFFLPVPAAGIDGI